MDCNIGTVLLFAGNYAPVNFALCDGSLLEIKQNAALYSIIGTKYGGNPLYFNLPKLDAPSGFTYIICTNGLYPERP